MVDTPFGGWLGIISTPRTLPLGWVRVRATYEEKVNRSITFQGKVLLRILVTMTLEHSPSYQRIRR